MAVTTVTTDLTDIGPVDPTGAEVTAGWDEPTDTAWDDFPTPEAETNFYIQGAGATPSCVSVAYSGKNSVRGTLIYDNTTAITVPTDGAIIMWLWWIAPTSLEPYANAGIFVAAGSSTSDLDIWEVSGSDFQPNPEGGWYPHAINIDTETPFTTLGTAPTSYTWLGAGISAPEQSRGQAFAIDAMRVGRCSSIVTGGTAPDTAASFTDISDTLQPTANAYGLFDETPTGFLAQGKLQFGNNATTAEVRFVDTNKNIFFRNTPRVNANFHRIEIQNGSGATSDITWTGCTFTTIGVNNPVAATASRGDFVVVDSTAVLTISGCAFVDMGTFSFGTGSTITDTAFRRTDQITSNGASFTRCTFRETIATEHLVLSNLSEISQCNFIGDSTSHAIDLGTVNTTTMNWDSTYDSTTYSSSSVKAADTPGTDNETILVSVNAGQTLTISVVGGDTPGVRNTGSGDVVIEQSVVFTITGIEADTELRLYKTSDLSQLGGGCEQISNTGSYGTGFAPLGGSHPAGNGKYSVTYTYDYASALGGADTAIYVTAHNLDYEWLRLDHTLLSSNTSIQINQTEDRQYNNPV